MNMVRVLAEETAKGIDTLAAKTQKVAEQASRLPGGQAAQWMLEEFKARNQVAYERYDSLTKQEQGIIDRWQALEYRLNPPAALLTGRQNSKLFGRNDPYGIIDTRRAVGYDKGKEGGGNELSQAGQGWAQPNQTKPGTSNAYAEYLAYKQKVHARQQRLALEQALQQLLVQEQAASAVADQQAFAYNGADGFASGGYETGGTAGAGNASGSSGIDGAYEAGDTFKSSGLDSGAGANSVLPAAGTGEATGQILSEGEADSKKNKIPDNDSTTGHIFRDAEGHIPDTPENRALLEDVANDSANFCGTDKYGNEWYTKTQSDGSQVWVESRNGNIFEGGVNDTPKPWNPETGLKKP